MKSAIFSYIAIFLLAIPLLSEGQFRKYSNEFLNIGAGARGLAMGSAQAASVDDATAGYWNPAALTRVEDFPSLSLMHASYFSNIANYEYAGVAIPVSDNRRTLGVSLLRFGVDDIPNTLFLVEPDGSINYNNISSFSSTDWAALLSFAQKIEDQEDFKASFGVNAKVIYRKVGQFANAWGFGLDAGFSMQNGNWGLAVVAKDVTTTFNAWSFHFTEKEKEVLYLTKNDIPVKSSELTAPRLTLASSYLFPFSDNFKLLAEGDLDFTFDGKRNTLISSKLTSVDPHLGLEAQIKDAFFVRAGITNFQKALKDGDTTNQKRVWIYQPSLGAGFKVANLTIDYAFSNLANQSNPLYTHIFSLKILFGSKGENY
ncbi:MAG: PorV/PorQ family protein [Chitinophagaceae bacterium]|nr:PorV/PorQ family protein [Chitinophagaceae bacterium]